METGGETSMSGMRVPCAFMSEDGTDLLAFMSSFSHFAGPNNPVLDLGNYMSSVMGMTFEVVTTRNPVDPEFARCISFPVHRELAGASSSMAERLAFGTTNAIRSRKAIVRLRPRRLVVGSSLDTAFEVFCARRAPVLLGWNVLLNVPQRRWNRTMGLPFWRPRSWGNAIYESLDRLASKTVAGGILAHSHFQERLYLALGIPQERIRVVPHCVDQRRLDAAARAPPDAGAGRPPVMLFAGNLEPWKGIMELLRAATEASTRTAITLLFVGRGSLAPYLEALSRRPPAERLKIEVHPWASQAALFTLLRGSAVCVLPSHVEFFGMVALEAMALGVPVIATRNGGIAELVRDGEDGFLVDPFDVSGFAAVLARTMEDPSLRARLGGNARARVAAEYDVAVVAPRFLRALEELS